MSIIHTFENDICADVFECDMGNGQTIRFEFIDDREFAALMNYHVGLIVYDNDKKDETIERYADMDSGDDAFITGRNPFVTASYARKVFKEAISTLREMDPDLDVRINAYGIDSKRHRVYGKVLKPMGFIEVPTGSKHSEWVRTYPALMENV